MVRRLAAILVAILVVIPAAIFATLPAYAQTLEHVAISQVVSAPPSVKVYLDIQGTGSVRVDGLSPQSLDAWFDGKPLTVNSLKPFSGAQEGVGYVFLVDVSKSESRSEFGKVKDALQGFVDHLGTNDKAAILSFGADTKEVTAYTGDKSALKSAINGLVNDAPMTHLNAALVEGLRLALTADTNLPSRRSIVILSDGKDEGSGLTSEDVLNKFAENRVPIYAIGASSLPPSQRAHYLEVLHRFAVLSGGAYYDATAGGVSSAYTQVYNRIAQVWVADLGCTSCPTDGRSYPLQVRVTMQGQSLTDKTDVAMAPGKPIPPPTPIWKRYSWPVYAGAGAAVVVLLGVIVWIARRRKAAATTESETVAPTETGNEPPPLPEFTPYSFSTPEPSVKPAPDNRPGLQVELVRKESRPNVPRAYTGKLVDQLVIGRSTGAAIQIPDNEISGQHCKLELVNGRVLLSDIGSNFGTAVNGVPIKVRQRIESGDSIALGKIEFRFRIHP
jgi:von Willebrand factor type A domain/FHA domain